MKSSTKNIIYWLVALLIAYIPLNGVVVYVDRTIKGRKIQAQNRQSKNHIFVVERVIDGDTIKLTNGEEVQLIGIKAPDDETMGQEATEFLKGLILLGPEVHLEFDVQERDKYGRLLVYVFQKVLPWDESPPEYFFDSKSRVFLNAAIIGSGYATPMTIPPNIKYADLFQKLHKEAREQKRGLWREKEAMGSLKNLSEPDIGSGTGGITITDDHVNLKDLSPEVKKFLIDSNTENIPPPCPDGTHLEGEFCRSGLRK